jgi:hypothetical protein
MGFHRTHQFCVSLDIFEAQNGSSILRDVLVVFVVFLVHGKEEGKGGYLCFSAFRLLKVGE